MQKRVSHHSIANDVCEVLDDMRVAQTGKRPNI